MRELLRKARHVIKHGRLPPYKQGIGARSTSALERPEVRQAVEQFIDSCGMGKVCGSRSYERTKSDRTAVHPAYPSETHQCRDCTKTSVQPDIGENSVQLDDQAWLLAVFS